MISAAPLLAIAESKIELKSVMVCTKTELALGDVFGAPGVKLEIWIRTFRGSDTMRQQVDPDQL